MIKASAPGKILWLGGYAVLERPNISLVTAVNARVHAHIQKFKEDYLEIPQFNINESITALSEDKKNSAKFVLAALSSVNSYIKAKDISIEHVKISTVSDPAFSVEGGKSGLGSSAAVTVATVAALLCFYGFKDRELVHKLAQYSHALAQGKIGSGFDIAAATYGTIQYTRYSPSIMSMDEKDITKIIDKNWDYEIKPIEWPSELRIITGNFIGESASTTTMVKKVMDYKKNNPEEYSEIIREIDNADRKAIDALKRKNYKEFAFYFNESRLLTKKLGEKSGAEIEPPKATTLIEKILKEGGALAAKLPGAGGGDSICVICSDSESERKTKEILQKENNIRVLRDLKIENKGLVYPS
ncbi:MAG: hypothetical protein QXS54_01810 [Candidatus Methanomethylicaceae archaeon]